MSGKSTDLVKAADFGLVALDPSNEIAEILGEALAGEEVGASDLERVKWPSSGRTKFERVILGSSQDVETITGVIVHQRMSRAYWTNPEPQEGIQPDCSSPDGEWGYGNPGDELRAETPPRGCKVCPFAQFGSAPPKNDEPQRGQACNLRRDFFILTEGATFPLIVSVPPASLGGVRGYLVDLASHGIRYWGVIMELSLKRAVSKGGQAYAEAVCKLVGRLDDESIDAVRSYREQMVPSLAATRAVAPETPSETAS